jgi:alpha-N-arabinofuranosidase
MDNNVTGFSRRHFLRSGAGVMAGLMVPAPVMGFFAKEKAGISVDLNEERGVVSPDIYGQFIEHLGRAIYGGIFDETNMRFRKDVLEKVKALKAPLMRYPGGTVTKIYHWKDGIGPVDKRPVRRNLIWGGEDTNHFGTDEFMQYSEEIGAKPFLTVNMNSGTAEEASDWVEYCNANGNSYFATLRKANGHAAPYNVKYWGLGNEEAAKEDAGLLQNPDDYIKKAWYFAKLMKLQDPDISLVLVGDNDEWNRKILTEMHPICDYISLHLYASSQPGRPETLFTSIASMEEKIMATAKLIKEIAPEKVDHFNRWYRFPSRQHPVKIALDEWGIWESGGSGDYDLEVKYNWNHALGVATFFNIFYRHADVIGMATWAQTVNVLAPVMTDKDRVFLQTVYYPMMLYRQLCGNKSVGVKVDGPASLDVAATVDEEKKVLTLSIVNQDPQQDIETALNRKGTWKVYVLNAATIDAESTFDKDVVKYKESTFKGNTYVAPAHSISFLQITL